MKIYLIRHGETTGDIEDRFGGDYDDHLTEKGIAQAEELAEKLKDKKIQIIFHSPRVRATQTAKIVNKVLNVNLEVVENIRERNNYGVLTGMVKSVAKEKYPEEFSKLAKTYHNVTGSEDYDSFKERIMTIFTEIISKDYQTIAIISHGGPISTIVREVLKLSELERLGDCAILELEKENGGLNLISLDGAKLEN